MKFSLLIKNSKFCNLRCKYCYEFPDLAKKDLLSPDQIAAIFKKTKDHLDRAEGDPSLHILEFTWHGGEPLVQSGSYWQELIDHQIKIFGHEFQKTNIINAMQTNLTLLKPDHLPVLKEHYKIGFSYDVLNDLRVNVGGQPSAELVWQNLKKLFSRGIKTSGIVVVSKNNIHAPEEIAEFYLSRGLSFKVLTIYRNLDKLEQIQPYAVDYDDFKNFLLRLWRLPSIQTALLEGKKIRPFYEAQRLAKFQQYGIEMGTPLNDLIEDDFILGVDTDGSVYGVGDMYRPDFLYGNILNDSWEKILASKGRVERILQTRTRFEKICFQCPFFKKGCNGNFVSHGTPEEVRTFETDGICHVGFLAKEMLLKNDANDSSNKESILSSENISGTDNELPA